MTGKRGNNELGLFIRCFAHFFKAPRAGKTRLFVGARAERFKHLALRTRRRDTRLIKREMTAALRQKVSLTLHSLKSSHSLETPRSLSFTGRMENRERLAALKTAVGSTGGEIRGHFCFSCVEMYFLHIFSQLGHDLNDIIIHF